jgi:predicted nucleotidyltransferase
MSELRADKPATEKGKMTLDQVRQLAVPACQEFNVKRLDVFGSFAQSRQTEASDLDLLVEFHDPDYRPSRRFFGLLHRLEDTFQRNVDLLTLSGLRNPFFRDRVMKERVQIYGS